MVDVVADAAVEEEEAEVRYKCAHIYIFVLFTQHSSLLLNLIFSFVCLSNSFSLSFQNIYKGGGRGGGGRGGGGMKGGAKVVIEPHRHEGVFIARGKEDALVTLNSTPGVAVYGEKRISVESPPGPDGNAVKVEYRVWNPFRSKCEFDQWSLLVCVAFSLLSLFLALFIAHIFI